MWECTRVLSPENLHFSRALSAVGGERAPALAPWRILAFVWHVPGFIQCVPEFVCRVPAFVTCVTGGYIVASISDGRVTSHCVTKLFACGRRMLHELLALNWRSKAEGIVGINVVLTFWTFSCHSNPGVCVYVCVRAHVCVLCR